jgi:hypothetical protein
VSGQAGWLAGRYASRAWHPCLEFKAGRLGPQPMHLRLPPASTTRTRPAPGPSSSWLTNTLLVWHFTVTACPEKLRRPPKSLQVDIEFAASGWIGTTGEAGRRRDRPHSKLEPPHHCLLCSPQQARLHDLDGALCHDIDGRGDVGIAQISCRHHFGLLGGAGGCSRRQRSGGER